MASFAFPKVDFLISTHRVKFKRNSRLPAARERDQVAVGIGDDETAGAPGFGLQELVKRDVFRLIFLQQGLGIVEDDRRRQQVRLRTQLRIDDRAVEAPEVQPRGVALDLGVKGGSP